MHSVLCSYLLSINIGHIVRITKICTNIRLHSFKQKRYKAAIQLSNYLNTQHTAPNYKKMSTATTFATNIHARGKGAHHRPAKTQPTFSC